MVKANHANTYIIQKGARYECCLSIISVLVAPEPLRRHFLAPYLPRCLCFVHFHNLKMTASYHWPPLRPFWVLPNWSRRYRETRKGVAGQDVGALWAELIMMHCSTAILRQGGRHRRLKRGVRKRKKNRKSVTASMDARKHLCRTCSEIWV